MRLLDARALIHEGLSRLVDDAEAGQPPFAILSHTWGQEEVLFSDIALGPYHEIDSPSDEQRKDSGYRSDRRKLDPELEYTNFMNQAAAVLPHINDTEDEDADVTSLPRVCEMCRHGSRPIISRQRGPHVKAGWNKIWNVCLQACRDGYDYVWVDTCCIDKSSSTELAEALNSMFRWYSMSETCYVLLEDVRLCPHRPEDARLRPNKAEDAKDLHEIFNSMMLDILLIIGIDIDKCTEAQIRGCRWLRRGWTLQEMIAPWSFEFFDRNWTTIGTRSKVLELLCRITGIPEDLVGEQARPWGNSIPSDRLEEKVKRLRNFPTALKMSWAANRQTTRIEDRAYSLLGLFDVNMPLLYGEGNRAFLRLQEEIIRQSSDDSIFAWEFIRDSDERVYEHQLLAPSPAHFAWFLRPGHLGTSSISFHRTRSNVEELDVDESLEITQKSVLITVGLLHQREKNEEDSTLSDSSERDSSDEDLPQRRSPTYATVQHDSEPRVKIKKGLALLNCHLGFVDRVMIGIALRLSHRYVGDKHITSQVICEEPEDENISTNLINPSGPRSRRGRRCRLALSNEIKAKTDNFGIDRFSSMQSNLSRRAHFWDKHNRNGVNVQTIKIRRVGDVDYMYTYRPFKRSIFSGGFGASPPDWTSDRYRW